MWAISALLLGLAAAVAPADAQTDDGCPGHDYVLVADRLCLLVTSPGDRDVAVSRCYGQADRFWATAWQLRSANRTLFGLVREALLRAGVARVWTEADVAYPGGMFVHGYPGNSLYNSPVWGLDLRPGDDSGSCLEWDVSEMTHRPRACGGPEARLPAVCLAELSAPRLEQAGCPQGFAVAPRVSRACLNFSTSEEDSWSWDVAALRCRDMGAQMVHKSFLGLYSASLPRSSYSCPLGVRLSGNTPVWTAEDGTPDEHQQVEPLYLRKLLGSSGEPGADVVGQVYLYHAVRYLVKPFGPQWRLVDAKSSAFNCVACEVPLPYVGKPEITVLADERGITVSVSDPEFLLRTKVWSWSTNGSSLRLVPKIRCYTDALTFYPVEVFPSKVEPTRLEFSPVGDGHYWCVGYDVFTTEPVFADRVLHRSRRDDEETLAVELTVAEPKTLVCQKLQVLREVSRLKYHVQGVLDASRNISGPSREDNDTAVLPDGLGPRYHFAYPDVRAGDTLAVTLFDERARGRLRRISRDCTSVLLHVKTPPGSGVAPKISVDGFYYSVVSVRPVDFCEDDITDHEWPTTMAGATAVVILEDRVIKRTCESNYDTGAVWGEEISGPLGESESTTANASEPSEASPSADPHEDGGSATSSSPHLVTPTAAPHQDVGDLVRSVEDADTLHSLSGQTLNSTGLSTAVEIIDHILRGDVDEVIERSSRPTTILHDVKTILGSVRLDGEEFRMVRPKVAVFVADVQRGDPESVRSMVLTNRDSAAEDALNGTIETADAGSPIGQRRDVEVAVVFPEMDADARISVAVYGDDRAFRVRGSHGGRNMSVNSRVVSVDIDAEDNATVVDERHSIEILFRPFEELGAGQVKLCAFWEFERGYEGRWSTDGCELVNSSSSSSGLDVCRCRHLTHFAEIITDGRGPAISRGNQLALDVISMVGCALSLAGVAGIATTAVAFPAWRRQLGNKLLLCLSAAVAINMAMFLLIAVGSAKEGAWCVVAGAGLHHSLLASFCWMLVSAWLQHRRLVQVLVAHHVPHLILKVSLFSWGVPTVAVAVLLCIGPEVYTSTTESGVERGFCFPTGQYFYWGVLAPVSVVVLVNVLIFLAIMRSIYDCCSRGAVQKRGYSKRHLNLRRLLTGVLLFFLLGLTWVFGFLSRLSVVFAYLFCVTASLQGLVLFLFFVAGERKLRDKWFPKESSTSASFYSSARPRRQTLVVPGGSSSGTGTYATSSTAATDESTPLRANIPLSQMTKITEW